MSNKKKILFILQSALHVRNFIASGFLEKFIDLAEVTLVLPEKYVPILNEAVKEKVGIEHIEDFASDRKQKKWLELFRSGSVFSRRKMNQTYGLKVRESLLMHGLLHSHYAKLLVRRFPKKLFMFILSSILDLEKISLKLFKLFKIKPEASALIEKAAPDIVFSSTVIHETNDVEIVKAAKSKNINLVNFIASWDNLTSKGFFIVRPDKLLVWGQADKDSAIKEHGFDAEQITITGAPHFDGYFDNSVATDRKKFLTDRKLDPENKIILFAGTSYNKLVHEPIIVERISAYLLENNKNDVFIWYRPHPLAMRIEALKKLNALPNVYADEQIMKVHNDPLQKRGYSVYNEDLLHYKNLLNACEGVITFFSTMGLECALFKKTAIYINFHYDANGREHKKMRKYRDMRAHFLSMMKWDGVEVADDFNALTENLDHILMLYLKNKISGIKNVLGIYTESTSKPYLIISVMVILGVSIALFESIGLSMLIPVLQKIIDGVDNNISIPIAWLSPMESWLNKWQGYRQLVLIISLIVISGLFKAVLMLINKLASEAISLRIGNYWREKLFKSILLADISKTLKHKTGHLQNSLVVECGRLRFIFRGMLQIFTALVMGLFYVLLLLTISVKLTIVVGLIFSIFSIPISRLIKHIRQTSFNRTEARSKVGAVIIEILSSLKIVHIFKTFDFEHERFKHSIDDVLYKEFQMAKKTALVGLINQLIGILVPLLIVSFGLFISYKSSAQARPLWIILFIAVFSRMLPIVQQMFNSMALISKFYGSLIIIKKQIESFSGHHLKNGSIKLNECPGQISMKNVSFGYDKDVAAVEDISLTIGKGESIAFVGPSGSGKSTLIGLVARLFDPNSGDIFLDSINLRDIDVNSWRNFIGLVDQNAILFNESIKYNISYGLEDISENEIIDAAKMANAHEFIVNLKWPMRMNLLLIFPKAMNLRPGIWAMPFQADRDRG